MDRVVAERAFVGQRLARVCHGKAKQRRINAAFDDEVGLPAALSAGTLVKAEASACRRASHRQASDNTVFKFEQNGFKARPTR